MRPAFLDNLSYAMAEVYGAATDQILINLARHFKYMQAGSETPGSFEYQARMLAQIGQVRAETIWILQEKLGDADDALKGVLEAAIMEALKNEEPKLRKAAELGLIGQAGVPEVTANQMQAFQAYYRQSADKLNLVNTVMLESTEAAYRATVSDVVNRVQRTQTILNTATGEVVTGVSTWNQALHGAVQKMVSNGLTGFVDHGGHRWSPEAYAAMDIRTTMFNTARAAVAERAESYGCDLYQVSSHNGARPLCYPWQGKVISRSDWTGEVEDLDGATVHVYAQSETSYSEAAGLFGVNCKHYPMTFIPGFSSLKGEPQDPEENEKAYAESQEQRRLERKLREEKRDLEVMKAQGASEEEIRAQRRRVQDASADIDSFCEQTGRARKRNREAAPVRAEWPTESGQKVTRFNGGYIGTDQVPPAKSALQTPPQNVASQATPETPVEHTIKGRTEKLARTMPPEDYEEVAKMIDNSETVTLYEKYGDSCQRIERTRNGGSYNRADDAVDYSYSMYPNQSKYSTMAHEMGHMFDVKIGRTANLTYRETDLINDRCMMGSGVIKTIKVTPSTSDQFLEAMRKDKVSLRMILNSSDEIQRMKSGSLRNATAGIQDAMDGFFGTQDKGILPWGHGDKYYNRFYNKRIRTFGLESNLKDVYNELGMSVTNQTEVKKLSRDYDTASELWANVVSALTCGGDELDAFIAYMPETVEAARKIIGGI